jgi:diguanylate cyclase (GGDEF)-like protein
MSVGRDDSDRREPELMALQCDILEGLARGGQLKRLMAELCRRAERLAPGVFCTVLKLGPDKKLQTLAAPSLPPFYSRSINGVGIGPEVGSCGAAAFLGKPVVVTDIAADPRWRDFRHLALPLGLKACWSSPIRGAHNRVLGAFAFYYRETRGPQPLEKEVVATCTRLCALAIEQDEGRRTMRRLAYTDALTGLPNRAAFQRRAEETLAKPRGVLRSAILSIDLDGFKQVNDDLGHSGGDRLLQLAAQRLARCVGRSNFIARVGGDEFAALLRGVDNQTDVDMLGAAIVKAFAEPFDVDGCPTVVGCSVGAAFAPAEGAELKQLLKSADLALYCAKSTGRNQYRLFAQAECASRREELMMEDDLRQAVARGEIEVHYQPIVDLGTSRMVGLEALARWRHPRRGMTPPAVFIPVAERSGLIVELGAHVLRSACQTAARWPTPVYIAVNLSALQLRTPGFALRVAEILAETRLPPSRLELELTESAFLGEDGAALRGVMDLKALGVAIAIDDFGTGYSALSYLRDFPVDRLKIDRSFVKDMLSNASDRKIVRALIGLANDLGVMTTAEGIETPEQLEWLKSTGCANGQGYLFGRPAPARELAGAGPPPRARAVARAF